MGVGGTGRTTEEGGGRRAKIRQDEGEDSHHEGGRREGGRGRTSFSDEWCSTTERKQNLMSRSFVTSVRKDADLQSRRDLVGREEI